MMKKIDSAIAEKATYVLTGIILLAIPLRLYHLDYQSLWLDELYSIIPTDPANSLKTVIELSVADQPPLFFIYIHYFFKIFGYSEIVGRMGCLIIGILSIPVMYLLGKECQNKRVGLMAALLTAVNYFHIYHSQELRFYGMVFLFSALSYLFFIRAYKRDKVFDFIGYTLATICLLYTHYFGLIVVLTQSMTFIFLLIYKRNLKFIISSVLSGIVILVAFIPWIPIILNDLGISLSFLQYPYPYFFAQYFYYYLGKDALTATLFVVFIFLFAKSFKDTSSNDNRNNSVYLIVIIWIVLTYLIPYIRSIIISPMLVVRYTMITLPAILIIVAIGWNSIKIIKYKYILAIVVVLAAILNLFFFRHYYTKIAKSQFREASLVVQSKNQFHLPIYSSLDWHFSFYFRSAADKVKNIELLYGQDSSVEQFWLLQGHVTDEEFDLETKKLSETFLVADKYPFHGANAILFRRKEK